MTINSERNPRDPSTVIQNLSCTSSMSCAIFFSYSCLPHTKHLQLLCVRVSRATFEQAAAHLLCPIQNMLRLSSFSLTATTAERRPKHTMSAYVGAPAGAERGGGRQGHGTHLFLA